MKVAFLLGLLVLALLLPESDASFFRRIGRKIKSGVRRVGSGIKDGVRRVGDGIRDGVRDGVRRVGDTLRDGAGRVVDRVAERARERLRGIFTRGKRSALTLNQADDVNTIDIATTLNLDLTAVQEVFVLSDVDKNGWLDGEELIAFLGMIEDLAGAPQEVASPAPVNA